VETTLTVLRILPAHRGFRGGPAYWIRAETNIKGELFLMAMTEYGPNHPLAVRLWAKRLFVESLRETFIDRFIGTSDKNAIIQMRDELGKSAGDRVTFGLRLAASRCRYFWRQYAGRQRRGAVDLQRHRHHRSASSRRSFARQNVRAARSRSAFVRSRWTA
jgi:hypothetical protein